MEETLLFDAVERMLKGEMPEQERFYFLEMRKNNPDFDREVAAISNFLNQFGQYSDRKEFIQILRSTEASLYSKGLIANHEPQGKAKIVFLWKKYRRTVAVAASIALIVSASCVTIVNYFHKDKQSNIKPLVEKLKEQDIKYKKLENQIGQLQSAGENTSSEPAIIESNFRATGFVIDVDNNYILTNAHVVSEAKNRLIVENNKGEQYNAESVYVNPESDIAIIRITDKNFRKLPSLPFSIRKSDAEIGEQVYTLGYPKQEIVYGEGYISARNGYMMDTIFCQLSTLANEGNSGSPVINKNGELIGVVSSKETNAEGVVYAIKSANIYSAISDMKKIDETENIHITSKPILRKTERSIQIKKVEDYVFMIKGN